MKLPSYRRHSSGQARVRITGKDYMLGAYGSKLSKEKYNRLIAEYAASGEAIGMTNSKLLIVLSTIASE